jgi:uncharacterized hydrophobic protein (TIGR00271 family)
VQHLRLYCAAENTAGVVSLLQSHPGVSSLAVLKEASVVPPGDVVIADLSRQVTNDVLDQLVGLGVQRVGTVQVETVPTWISQAGFESERRARASGADAVIWPDVVQRAYEESELNWTYISFMVLATLIAGIAIILDSQILTIGAMVLGPEFGPIAAIGLALVRRRRTLFKVASRTLLLGFVVAIAATTVITVIGRWLGWVTMASIMGPRPGTAFIYEPDKWSFVVAVIAAAAGVLSLTSARTGGLSGVFISVTTVPAAGNVALGLAFGAYNEIRGSALQLVINIAGMALAGGLTLALQQTVWRRISHAQAHHPPVALEPVAPAERRRAG